MTCISARELITVVRDQRGDRHKLWLQPAGRHQILFDEPDGSSDRWCLAVMREDAPRSRIRAVCAEYGRQLALGQNVRCRPVTADDLDGRNAAAA